MKAHRVVLLCLCISAGPAAAQTQIGGGACFATSLSGSYSLTLSGRELGSQMNISALSLAVGTATFDGQGNVTFSLNTNTNKAFGLPQTLSGTYSLQSNCQGSLTLTSGDSASFTLDAFNNPTQTLSRSFALSGEDGVYSFTGSGSLLPASCSASLLSGVYSFNATGFVLANGSVSGVADVSGLLTFDGKNAVTSTWYVSGGTTVADTTSGQFSVAAGCTGTATLTDASGTATTLSLTLTAANGSSFLVAGASPALMFSGSGRMQDTPAACTNASLSGTSSLVLTGRNLNASHALSATYQAVGIASFDGAGSVTFLLQANTKLLQGVGQTLTGVYNLGANCIGTLNIAAGDSASYTLIAWNQGKSFSITGQDASYVLTGTGAPQPPSCITSLVSGTWVFNGSGYALSSTNITGVNGVSGHLTFDGRGVIGGDWTIATNQSASSEVLSGHYSVNASCQVGATVTGSSGAAWTLAFTMTSADGANFGFDAADSATTFSANGHSTFTNPGLAVANAASGVGSGTPAGSLFALYGANLASAGLSASQAPLPGTLLSTTVTVNNETAPLLYVSPTQINAQMPWDIQPGLVNVVVTNGGATSNTVAVMVPATTQPGVFVQPPGNQAIAVEYPEMTDNSPRRPPTLATSSWPISLAADPLCQLVLWSPALIHPSANRPLRQPPTQR